MGRLRAVHVCISACISALHRYGEWGLQESKQLDWQTAIYIQVRDISSSAAPRRAHDLKSKLNFDRFLIVTCGCGCGWRVPDVSGNTVTWRFARAAGALANVTVRHWIITSTAHCALRWLGAGRQGLCEPIWQAARWGACVGRGRGFRGNIGRQPEGG